MSHDPLPLYYVQKPERQNMITLYDVGPHKYGEGVAMSPFVRGIRLALHFKKIPYTVKELGGHELESTAKSIGAQPTMDYTDGSPKYTVPMIQDSKTGKVLSDSFLIAEYLDEAYPDTPRIIPPGTRMLQLAFCTLTFRTIEPLLPVVRPIVIDKFLPSEVSKAVRKVFEESGAKLTMTEEEQAEAWRKVIVGFKLLAQGYGEGDSPFVMGGTTPTYADMRMAGFLWVADQVVGDSQGWKDIKAVADGKFARLYEETLAVCNKQA
ncbi:hypothetical protein V5O48_007673 [Marasmius crinis-equi]|uniref:GST N-terminal domain-containing protein n=1 Tax=Marasmius crinis-equi TaxID=585013 RepID=A0ABR3FG51_9AGAR